MITLIPVSQISLFTAQKANVSYSFLDSSLKHVTIPVGKELRAICQLFPSLEVQDEFCLASVSVVQYTSLSSLLPILSSNSLHPQFQRRDVRSFDSVVDTRSIDVSIILLTSSSVQKWKSLTGVAEMIRNILSFFVVVNGCLVIVPTSCRGTLNDIKFICVNATSSRNVACRITSSTFVKIEEILSLSKFESRCTNDSAKVIGLSQQLKFLDSIYNANVMFKKAGDYSSFNCIQKVLIIGPSGCGKSALVKSFAKNKKCGLIVIEGSLLAHTTPGESENILRSFFIEAINRSKEGEEDICIVLLDQVENICRKSKFAASHLRRLSNQLFHILETINESPGVIIIATTSHVHSLDPVLRRSSRIQTEIYIGMPNEKERQEIIQLHDGCLKVSVSKKIAACTPGYNGADLAFLVQNVNRLWDQKWKHPPTETDLLELFNQCLRSYAPSAMRGGLGVIRLRDMRMDQLGGLEEVKSVLKRYIEWPLKYSAKFNKLGIPIPKGLLLYGPPGCAKTSLVCAIANATNTTFLAVSAAELYSPYVGESERNVVDVFQKARMNSPCILFIDEIDTLIGNRNTSSKNIQTKILSAFLTEMDGFNNKLDCSLQNRVVISEGKEKGYEEEEEKNNIVIVVGATNRPDKLDSAFLRPGRLDKLIYVNRPDRQERLDILHALVLHSKMPLSKCVDLNEIAGKTENFTGADLKSLMKEAGYLTLFKDGMDATFITRERILESLVNIKPTVWNDSNELWNFINPC